jgi:hypothetical protein
MVQDTAQRVVLSRVDSNHRRGKVMACRDLIYDKNYQVDGSAIEKLLQKTSLVPNMVRDVVLCSEFRRALNAMARQNAFSDRLFHLGFNMYSMMVPDLMHEIETGVWRSLFIHLLRMLQSIDESLLVELDRRYDQSDLPICYLTNYDNSYRQIPSFGRDTIRRFSANCSEMKKMTAHDFEDLLQARFEDLYYINFNYLIASLVCHSRF